MPLPFLAPARRTPRALAAAAALLALPALAGAQDTKKDEKKANTPPPAEVQTQQAVVTPLSVSQGNSTTITRTVTEDFTSSVTIDAAPEQAWAALKSVYQQFKIPTNTLVDAERRIGTGNVRFRDKVANERASKGLNCGRSGDGREAADSYELTLDIQSVVGPAPNGRATVYTTITGMAKPIFMSGDAVRCMSTGRIEERIATAVRNLASGSAAK